MFPPKASVEASKHVEKSSFCGSHTSGFTKVWKKSDFWYGETYTNPVVVPGSGYHVTIIMHVGSSLNNNVFQGNLFETVKRPRWGLIRRSWSGFWAPQQRRPSAGAAVIHWTPRRLLLCSVQIYETWLFLWQIENEKLSCSQDSFFLTDLTRDVRLRETKANPGIMDIHKGFVVLNLVSITASDAPPFWAVGQRGGAEGSGVDF